MDVPLRTWAEIDLDALRHNLAVFATAAPPPTRIIGVVKADAYGHGAVAVARCLRAAGVETLAVATLEEAIELREAGLDGPLWHLGVPLAEEAPAMVHYRVTPTAPGPELLAALAACAGPTPFEIHLKLDTGMGRRGGEVEAVRRLWEQAEATGKLRVAALTTHFATPDVDLEYAREQLDRFVAWRTELAAAGLRVPAVHLCSGLAALRLPSAHFDAIRPGLLLYGVGEPRVRPVMTLKSRLCQVRELPAGHEVGYAHGHRLARPTRVGLVPIGYGDGWPWALSRGAEALVAGRRVPYLGRVNMDLIQLDLNNVPGADVGEEVVLLGGAGEQRIDASEIAGWAATSPYSITTSLGRRVTRRYLEAGRVVAQRGLDGRLRES